MLRLNQNGKGQLAPLFLACVRGDWRRLGSAMANGLGYMAQMSNVKRRNDDSGLLGSFAKNSHGP